MQRHFQIKNEIGGDISHRKAQGREYIVAPMIAVRSQVLNDMYLPPEEIEMSLLGWPDVPITHNHPDFTARDPDIPHMGRFYNATFEDNSLKGEAWYDVELVKQHGEAGDELISRLESGEIIEVSTGYYASLEFVEGTFEDKEYFAIQRGLVPDHIATLLHDIGACSVEDGCGVPRRNQKELIHHNTEVEMSENKWLNFANAILAHAGAEPITAEDLDDLGLEEEVEEEVEEPVAEVEEEAEEPVPVPQAELPEGVAELGELVTEFGIDRVRGAIAAVDEEQQNERTRLIQEIGDCSRCQFNAKELAGMSTLALRKLQASLNGVDFSGRAAASGGEKPLVAPPVFLAKKENTNV